MDPINNQQVNNQVPNPAVPSAAPQIEPTQPEQVGSPMPKKNNRLLLYVVLIGLLVIILVGVAAFYMWNSAKKSQNIGVVPTPVPSITSTPQEVEVAEVTNVSDLENLIIGLAQADESLDQELTKLQKDSDF